MEKKNNFFPLLLIGGGIASAALLYFKGSKQSKESLNMLSDNGLGGSGDFLGSSGVSKGYDSTELGIEDFAFNRASPDAYSLPSDGAVNPEYVRPEYVYDDSGERSFADTAVLGLTAASLAGTAAKGAKTVATKVGQTTAVQAVKTAATKAAGSTVGKAASAVAKGAGVLGALSLVDTFFEMTGVKDAHFSGGLTGNLQGVNTSLSVKTDEATKASVGNMATTQRQEAIVKSLMTGSSSKRSEATPEETEIVNTTLGTSGDVVKVTYGKYGGTSFVASSGKQISYAGGTTLQQTAQSMTEYKRSQSAGAKALPSSLKSSQH